MALLDQIKALDATLLAGRDPVAIAAALSAGRKKRNTREIGNGAILETIGLAAGNTFLDVINSVSDFRHVKTLVTEGRLQVGSPLVQASVQSMVAGSVLSQAQADALCALGKDADPVSELEVRRTAWDADGNWLGG